MHIAKEEILGIGLGTVGPLERITGMIQNPQYFQASGWNNVPIKNMLEEKLDLPVFVDNGANTAILAESIFGEAKGYRNVAYFNIGMGIRTGALAAGTIVRTLNDAEDAFGHMVIDVDGRKCNGCGNFGCIDCYSSIYSILQQFKAALKKGRTSSVNDDPEQLNYISICEAAEDNDVLAKEIITEAATIFGVGLANYINLLNPSIIFLGGPLIYVSDLFYRVSIQVALDRLYFRESPKIVFSKGGTFKDQEVAIGAAAMVVEEYLHWNSKSL